MDIGIQAEQHPSLYVAPETCRQIIQNLRESLSLPDSLEATWTQRISAHWALEGIHSDSATHFRN
jgi:hypothetical protein